MASLLGVGGIWKDEFPASLQTCQLIIRTGRGRQIEIHRQSSSLKTIWRLGNWEGEVRRIWRQNTVSDTEVVRGVWERREAAELPTCVRHRSCHRDFTVVIRTRLSWSFSTQGRAFFGQNGQDQGEEDAWKWIHVKPQKVEAKQMLGASTSEDTGLFFVMVVPLATIPVLNQALKAVCLIRAKFKLENRRFFLVFNPNDWKYCEDILSWRFCGLWDHKNSFFSSAILASSNIPSCNQNRQKCKKINTEISALRIWKLKIYIPFSTQKWIHLKWFI